MITSYEEQEKRIQQFRPIDDTFFQVLADNVEFCQEILRVILEDNALTVQAVTTQKDVKNLAGRSVRLDALCTLGNGTKCNVEVQRSDNDDHLKRIRYNSSCITASETEPGAKFENVPTVIVVYISEFDFLNEGRTIYHIDHVIRETGTVVDNGLYTVCVNTKVNDGSDIAELMHCFTQTEVDNEKFPIFSSRMYYLKHSKGGSKNMCKVMEEYAQEYAREYAQELMNEKIKKALSEGIAPEMLVSIFDVSFEEIFELQNNNTEKA
ncbi:MAG: PD-(D/E)XK nuclease family transposase [Lachnospiraceae bacterium]|nr:PD-(D/E)XK nuclease family transposase [Lachnospiraceae bacterium]